MKRWSSTAEAAMFLGVSHDCVNMWRRKGYLRGRCTKGFGGTVWEYNSAELQRLRIRPPTTRMKNKMRPILDDATQAYMKLWRVIGRQPTTEDLRIALNVINPQPKPDLGLRVLRQLGITVKKK